MNTLIKGKSVHFDDRYLHIELEDGRIISTPMNWYKELQTAIFNTWGDVLMLQLRLKQKNRNFSDSTQLIREERDLYKH